MNLENLKEILVEGLYKWYVEYNHMNDIIIIEHAICYQITYNLVSYKCPKDNLNSFLFGLRMGLGE